MRRIALFDLSEAHQENNLGFNLGAELARNGKKVLILDLRYKTMQSTFGQNEEVLQAKNVYHCMNENMNLEHHALELESNLFVVFGTPDLPKIELHQYYALLRQNYFDKYLSNYSYDYVFLLVSPFLTPLTLNALTYALEAISIVPCDPDGFDYQQKVNRFLHYLKRFYGKSLFLSKVIPYYHQFLDQESYQLFVSEMTQLLVTPPVPLEAKHPSFKRAIKSLAPLIIEDEERFDTKYSHYERQKKIDEYYHLAKEEREKPLESFVAEKKQKVA